MSFRFWWQNYLLCSIITIPLKHSVERDWNIKSTMENCGKSHFPEPSSIITGWSWAMSQHETHRCVRRKTLGTGALCGVSSGASSFQCCFIKPTAEALWEWSSPVQCCAVHNIPREHPHSIQKFILSEAARSRRQKLSKERGYILDYAVCMASLWSLCRKSHSRWIGGL